MIGDEENLGNHQVYAVDESMGSCILDISDDVETCRDNVDKCSVKKDKNVQSGVCKMFFHVSSS